jgi:hypothetical protein
MKEIHPPISPFGQSEGTSTAATEPDLTAGDTQIYNEATKYLADAPRRRLSHMDREQVQAAIYNAEAMLPQRRVAINMPLDAFIQLVNSDDQKYKTAFETGYSRGHGNSTPKDSQYVQVRSKKEAELGLTNPIYGYLGNADGDEYEKRHKAYGSVRLTLKADVLKRASFTSGDSLARGSRLLNLSEASLLYELNEIQTGYDPAHRGVIHDESIEAQVKGEVTLGDVEQVKIQQAPDKPEDIAAIIKLVKSKKADLKLKITLPAPAVILPKLLGLITANPDVNFVFTINPALTGAAGNANIAPFPSDLIAQRTASEHESLFKINKKLATDSALQQDTAANSLRKLQLSTQEYFNEIDQTPPENIDFKIVW